MWLELLSDPVFLIAAAIFVFVMAYFYWLEKREKERKLEERLKRLEQQQEKFEATFEVWSEIYDNQVTKGSIGVTAKPRFCRYCGAKTKADTVFCENCGKQLSD